MDAELEIQKLDLEPIKYKLVIDGQWSHERANQAESHYKRFLILIVRNPHSTVVPIGDIDLFWHQHILDTRKYAVDCECIFGKFLHHYPYFGLRGAEDADRLKEAITETEEMFISNFGIVMRNGHQCAACQPGGTCGDQHCEEELEFSGRERPRFQSATNPKL